MSEPIVVTKHIAAPPADVYRYLTDSDLWARWQGIEASVQAKPGGLFLMSAPNGHSARGEFVELIPEEKVVFTWGWVDHPGVPPGSSTVEIELSSTDDGTLVTLTHRDLPPEELDLHRAGWNHYLPRLAIAAEGGDPGQDVVP